METSNGMNPRNKSAERERRMLPFVIEFVKFSIAFAFIITAALITLRAASAAMG